MYSIGGTSQFPALWPLPKGFFLSAFYQKRKNSLKNGDMLQLVFILQASYLVYFSFSLNILR
jgi:hypothetical protein